MTSTEKADLIKEVINRVKEEIKKKQAVIEEKIDNTGNNLMKVNLLHQDIGYQDSIIAAIDVNTQMLKEINDKQETELKRMVEKAMN